MARPRLVDHLDQLMGSCHCLSLSAELVPAEESTPERSFKRASWLARFPPLTLTARRDQRFRLSLPHHQNWAHPQSRITRGHVHLGDGSAAPQDGLTNDHLDDELPEIRPLERVGMRRDLANALIVHLGKPAGRAFALIRHCDATCLRHNQ